MVLHGEMVDFYCLFQGFIMDNALQSPIRDGHPQKIVLFQIKPNFIDLMCQIDAPGNVQLQRHHFE